MNWTEEEYNAFLERQGKKPPPPKKRNKLNAVKTDGYDSKKEAEYARELNLRAMAEPLQVLEQVPFQVSKEIKYIADFVLLLPDGKYEVHDVKGYKGGSTYANFKMKKKLMKEKFNIEVIEI